MAVSFKSRVSFTVPATSGNYAPERITLARPSASMAPNALLGATIFVESNTATGATVELWLLSIGADPTLDASFFNSGQSLTSGELTVALASYPGAQIRVKSGGTAGATVVDATADE